MTDTTGRDLRNNCEEAESTQDEPLSGNATRPGWQRAKVLSVRLNPEEFDELTHYAAILEVPASTLARGWSLDQLRAGSESPVRTVERVAHELEQLRRQLVA